MAEAMSWLPPSLSRLNTSLHKMMSRTKVYRRFQQGGGGGGGKERKREKERQRGGGIEMTRKKNKTPRRGGGWGGKEVKLGGLGALKNTNQTQNNIPR